MAGDLRDILNTIRAERGRLTPAIVVEAAQDEDHPLHHRFEWDDAIAGRRWRLHQAGNLLRVKVTHERGEDQDPISLRAFMPVRAAESIDTDSTDDPDTEYVPTEEVLQDPVARQVMLRQMRRDANNFRRRWEHMQEYDQVVNELSGNGDDGDGDEQQQAS